MQPLVVSLVVLLVAAAPLACGSHQFFQMRDLNERSGWRLDGSGASGQVDCLADDFKPFDDGMSSFRQEAGELKVYRNHLFVNQLFSQAVAPGSGFSKVNLSPNLENQASSWRWSQFPFGLPLPSRRSLKQNYSPQQQSNAAYGSYADESPYPASEDAEPMDGNSTYVYWPPSSGNASSVTWYTGPSASWGDYDSRGPRASFDGNASREWDLQEYGLAWAASSVAVCGANMTAYPDSSASDPLFNIQVEDGYCVDVTLDSGTENRVGYFGYVPSAQYQRSAYHEKFGISKPFDLQQSSVVYLAPTYEPCVSPWQAPSYPQPLDGATQLPYIGDDDYETVSFTRGFVFRYFGQEFTSVHIGSNGFLSFAEGSVSYQATLDAHTILPRVSALMTDLDPTGNGSNSISYQQLPDLFVVTYDNIVSYGSSGPGSSLQVALGADGTIRVTYLQVNLGPDGEAIVGLSGPSAISGSVSADLSARPPCATCGFGLPACPPPPPVPGTLVCAWGVDFSWDAQAVTVSCQTSGASSHSLTCDGELAVQHLKDDGTVTFSCQGATLYLGP